MVGVVLVIASGDDDDDMSRPISQLGDGIAFLSGQGFSIFSVFTVCSSQSDIELPIASGFQRWPT